MDFIPVSVLCSLSAKDARPNPILGARRALRPVEAISYEIDAEATQMQQVGGESVMLPLSLAAPKYCFPR